MIHRYNFLNPLKAVGSESMYSLMWALQIRYKVKKHVHSPIFQGQLIEKKNKSITFIVWVLERFEKNALKKVKKMLKIFFLFKINIKM